MTSTMMTRCLLFALLLGSLGCKKEDDTYTVGNKDGVALSHVISFYSITPVRLDADSATTCTITVKISAEASSGNNGVHFSTDGGTFANGDTSQTVTANSEGYASAYLLSNKSKQVHVRASVISTYSIDTTVTFVPALPDDLLLTADTYTGDTSTTFNVTGTLYRNVQRGKVFEPVKVVFSVVPRDTTVNLVYPAFAFSQGQTATVTLTNPYKVTGRFDVTSKVLSSGGDSLSRTILLEIK